VYTDKAIEMCRPVQAAPTQAVPVQAVQLAPIAAAAKPPQPSKSKKSNGNRSAEPVTIAD
jgi:hypothetical protein